MFGQRPTGTSGGDIEVGRDRDARTLRRPSAAPIGRSVAVVLVVALVATACGSGAHESAPTASDAAPTTAAKATTSAPTTTTTTDPAPMTTTTPVTVDPVTTVAPTSTVSTTGTVSTTTTVATTSTSTAADWATQARTEAGTACAVLSAFDGTQVAAITASRAEGGDETADEGPGALAAAEAAFDHAFQAHLIATVHVGGRQGTVWDDLALAFALLDASLGGHPADGIGSPVNHAVSSEDYADVGQRCEGDFGSSFPTLSL